jgi:D-inositol-3-phosphate glycosyltransferase
VRAAVGWENDMLKVAMVSEHPASGVIDAGDDGVIRGRDVELASALGAHDVDVRMYVRRDDAAIPDEVRVSRHLTVTPLPAGPARQLPPEDVASHLPEFGESLAASLRAWPSDVIHARSCRAGLAALHGRRSTLVPLVHTFHGTDPGLERTVCADAEHVVASCRAQLDDLRRIGTPRSKVTVVPSGVDLDLFRPDVPALLPSTTMRLLCVGRVLDQHRFDLVIPALRVLPGVELVIAGGPSRERLADDPEAARLTGVAKQWGVADRVRLLGHVPYPRMPAVFASADVVVCAPRYATAGQVSLEAAACGVPVVATAVGGLVDTVLDGVTGILVPPHRAASLIQAIRALRVDPMRLDGYALAGRERAHARHSWSRLARETAGVYASVAARPVHP